MINQAGLAAAGSMNAVRLAIAALVGAGVLAVGLLSGPATASADNAHVNNCSAVVANVVCVGQINGNPVTVNVGDVLSGNQLSAFTADLEDVFVSVVNIQDINILSADLNAAVETVVNNTFNTTTKTCTVAVAPPAATTQTSAITVSCS